MGNAEFVRGLRRAIALDQAMAKLHEAGLADAFITAVEKDPELLKAVDKMAPGLSPSASPGWSCCVTVSNPLLTGIEERINPAEVRAPRERHS